MIDYVMVKKEIWKDVKDVKVIPGEERFSQHRLLTLDLTTKHRAAKEMRKPERIRLWRLKTKTSKKKLTEQIKETHKKADSWQNFGNSLLVAARKVCGITKNGQKRKITWWWNAEVKEAIRKKKISYKLW